MMSVCLIFVTFEIDFLPFLASKMVELGSWDLESWESGFGTWHLGSRDLGVVTWDFGILGSWECGLGMVLYVFLTLVAKGRRRRRRRSRGH
jgi:hypothetical protein